jgi:hypothetical protein
MKAMSKFWTALVVGGLVMVSTALSWAGPLLPSFPDTWVVGQAVAGESTLSVIAAPEGTSPLPLKVDWIVVYLGPTALSPTTWGYYYQIENPTGQVAGGTVAAFSVATPGPPFIGAGFLTSSDIENDFVDFLTAVTIKGHTASNYSNLGSSPPPPETELATLGTGWDPVVFPIPAPTGTTWSFGSGPDEVPVGYESSILFAYATAPPMYGSVTAIDDGIAWKGLVPVPSPEPGAAALLMMGLTAFGVLTYRRRSLAK